jgi:hypothetical protein
MADVRLWGCECGAVWESETDEPPVERMCSLVCPKPELFPLAAPAGEKED